MVANELFDAVPIRQYRESGRDAGGSAASDAMRPARSRSSPAPAALDPALLPPGAADGAGRAVAEIAPARSALMQHAGWADGRGRGYGPGDRLRLSASRRSATPCRRYASTATTVRSPNPGHADLTAHVDFAALAAVARAHGLGAALLTQGEFLSRLGLKQRAERWRRGRRPRARRAAARRGRTTCRAPARWASCSRCWPSVRADWLCRASADAG